MALVNGQGSVGSWVATPQATSILVGLGVNELSLNPAGIPRIKSILRDLTLEDARALAERALRCQTSAEVRKLAQDFETSSSS